MPEYKKVIGVYIHLVANNGEYTLAVNQNEIKEIYK